jgi:hypothetical protein
MAGFEIEINLTEAYKDEIINVLRIFKTLGRSNELRISYKIKSQNQIKECWLKVDGSLLDMQVCVEDLKDILSHQHRFDRLNIGDRQAKIIQRNVYLPTIKQINTAVTQMTSQVEGVARRTGGVIFGPILTAKMRRIIRQRKRSSLKELIEILEHTRQKLISGTFSDIKVNISQTIIIDQALETYLKDQLNIDYRIDFPVLTTQAVSKGLITTNNKSKFDAFHAKRNKAQHNNIPIDENSMYSYLVFLCQFIDSLLRNASSKARLIFATSTDEALSIFEKGLKSDY